MINPHPSEADWSSIGMIVRLAALPATLLHELTHLVAAAPWSNVAAVVLADGGAECQVDWRDEAPAAGIAIAALAPTLVGGVVGAAGLLALAGSQPETAQEWLRASVAAIYWGIFAAPSAGDRAQARQATADNSQT